MSATAVTTFSPSSSSSTLSTPCVEGCCGPMLRTMVFAVPTAVSTVVVVMVYILRAGSLALYFHREIPAKRSALKAVGQQNSPQIRVPFKVNAKQVKHFAFQPVRARPHWHQRVNHCLLPGHIATQAK